MLVDSSNPCQGFLNMEEVIVSLIPHQDQEFYGYQYQPG